MISYGRFFLELLLNNRSDYYGLRIHVELGLRRRGFPIQKSSNLEELLSGEELIAIAPYSYHFDSKTARENGFETTQSVMLPEEECDDLIKEVTWLPVTTVGDFCYRSSLPPEWYLRQLKGHKYLILGNHDGPVLNNPAAQSYLEGIDQMMKIEDGKEEIHYVIIRLLSGMPIIVVRGIFMDIFIIVKMKHISS